MTEQVTDREVLQELAARPIGGPELMEEASRYSPEQTPSADLREASARACKIWLPAGKRSARDRSAKEAEQAFRARQVDLEDAVEAAGGERGRADRHPRRGFAGGLSE